MDCPYYPESNGTMKFKFEYPAKKGNHGTIYKCLESDVPEVIITPDMLRPDIDAFTFYVYAYIADNETQKEYCTYSDRITLYLNN